MSRFADLHIHTFYSDSTSSPQEVIEHAQQAGLSAIAITDHDTVDGIKPTREAGKSVGIEVLSGIELSSEINNRDVHILGYCFDENNARLIKSIHEIQNTRQDRMKEMIAKLKKLGVEDITFEEVAALAQSRSVGRPHLAQVLIKKKKVADTKQAFGKYLAEGAAAYVPKFKQSPFEAIELIRKAGGVAVLAHPMVTGIDEIIPRLVKAGMGGIEVYYPNTSSTLIAFYEGLALKHDLIMTGGSDSHGKARSNTFVGRIKLPYEKVEQLKKAAGQ